MDFPDIEEITACLKADKIVLYPTDTIWGIGCIANSKHAIERIYKLKGRSKNMGMILLVDSLEHLEKYVRELPKGLLSELNDFAKPLTVVYPEVKKLPSFLLAEDGSVAIRIVKDSYCAAIISKLGFPIISTSANISGQAFDGDYQNISQKIVEGVDYVSLYKRNSATTGASRILKLGADNSLKVIRE